jgi:hypothetical protein
VTSVDNMANIARYAMPSGPRHPMASVLGEVISVSKVPCKGKK